ncbi:hypothetical protein [Arthrobacter sp. ISL-5]|uniref:hypothetical protein n=1 Tax=Arthrobacter sp. ISL-5 TaxID=2819111 RepID=UPI001BEBDC73|nr:hypothetical protein [Arthrobacter sp. ISL-5]MBT2551534.1 hypothetical protein [Arthrobacter sp. ISL-5]
MEVFRTLMLAFLSCALCVTGCTGADGPAPGQTAPTTTTTPTSETIRIYSDPVFKGAPTGELNVLADKVNEYAMAHPKVFSGTYFASDYSKVYVGVAKSDDPAASAYEKLAAKLDPGRQRVVTADARWSWYELDALKDLLVKKYLTQGKGGIQSVGLNTAIDSVVIAVLRKPLDPALTDNRTVIEIARRYGDMVVFRESLGPITAAAR